MRLDLGESQKAFAERTGVPLRTYKRFESHGRAHLDTFVRALRTLGRTEYLFMLFPGPKPTAVLQRLLKRAESLSLRSGGPEA